MRHLWAQLRGLRRHLWRHPTPHDPAPWRLWLFVLCGGLAGFYLLVQVSETYHIDSFNSCVQDGNLVSDGNIQVCHAGGHAFTGPQTPEPVTPAPGVSQAFDLLVSGESGGTYPPNQLVIQTQAEWERYWQTVHAGRRPMPPLISVDFQTRTVIAVNIGPQPTTGYNLRISSIEQGPAGSTVDVTESVPTITCPVKNAASNLYRIVSTPKLAEPAIIRLTKEMRHC